MVIASVKIYLFKFKTVSDILDHPASMETYIGRVMLPNSKQHGQADIRFCIRGVKQKFQLNVKILKSNINCQDFAPKI